MKVKMLISILIIIVCVSTFNLNVRQAYASNHVHTNACYSGHRHTEACNSYPTDKPVSALFYEYWGYEGGCSTDTYVVNIVCNRCNRSLYTMEATKTYQNGNFIAYWPANHVYLLDHYTGNTITFGYDNIEYSIRFDQVRNIWQYLSNKFTSDAQYHNYGVWDLGIPYYPYEGCRYCGTQVAGKCSLTQDETPDCAAATIAPLISLNNMTSSTVLSESNTSFCPQIKVYDNENDSLSCKYYLDGSTTATGLVTASQSKPETVVTFPISINAQNLYEGTHAIKVTAEDGMAPTGVSSLTFKVDKSAPIVNSISTTNTISSVKLDVSASDAVAGLASSAYRYTIGGVPSDWLTLPTYTKSGLSSNTNYSYTIEVRDSVGHITTRTGITTTKVGVPQITASALAGGGIQAIIKDANSDGTQYMIKVGSQYAKLDGTLSAAETWITPSYDATVSGRKLILSGLTANTEYVITALAKNATSGEIVPGGNVTVKTAPKIPTGLNISDVSQGRIQLNWNMDDGAVSYNLSRQSVTADGTVTFTKFISDIVTNNYSDTDLSPNQIYRYRIQGKNQYGTCSDWSTTPISTKSLPQLPPKITDIVSKPDGSSLDISWPSIAAAVGYELEVSYGGVPLTNKIVDNKFHFDKGQYDNQCSIRVRAYNVCDVSNPADSSHWSNVGEWSTPIISYTDADKPALEQIVAEQVTNNSVVIKWDKNNNPPSVQYVLGIYCNGVLKEERTVAGTLSSDNKLTSTITGLLPETSYTFCLKAVNSTGKATDWSNEVNTMTRIDKPSLLTGLRATAKSNTINLFWNSSLRAQSYSIERNDQVIAENIEGTSYIDNNVTSETEYTYRVKAVNTTGESEWSPKLIKKTLGELPTAPSPSVTAATGSAISLVVEWAPQSGVTGYDVEADGNVHNVGMNPSYTDDGLTPGSTHTYRVRSRNIYGKSDWSSAVTMKLVKDVPTTPIGVSATASDADLLIHWNTVEEAETYDVEINSTVYSGITSADYLYHLSGTAVSGSAIKVAATANGEYIIRVRAVNQGGESDWSEAVTAGKTGAGGSIPILPIPEVPVLKSSVFGSTTISLTWDNTDNASVYQLESDGSILYTGSGAGYIHSGLTANSTHTYRIRSGNYSGYSNWSEPITATTNSVNTTTPQNISYYRNADGSTAIIWDKVTGVLGYRVEVNGLMAENIIQTEQTVINTVQGMQYKVRIASIIPDGENTELDWSDEMDFRAPSNLPNVPIVDKVTATNDTIDITWSKADRALGYEVELDGKTTDAGNQLTYCIAGLKASSSYSIRIRAYNESGAGEWSKAKTIVTGQGIPGVPINIMVEAAQTSASVTGAAITVRCDTINGAESYETEAADGTIYKSNTNSVIIDNLTPGERYYFRVRAVTEAGKGAWSSRISYVPMLTTPTNLAIQAEGGGVHLTWDKAGIADSYEIEVDGIIYATTNATAYDFNKEIFSLKRTIRVRASWGTQKSEWPAVIQLSKPLSVTEAFAEGEEFSVLLPVKKAELSKYKLTLKYNTNELELLDACQATPKSETESIYIKQFKTHIIISEESGMTSITYLFDDGTSSWTGLAGSIRFRSKVNNTVTLQYGVAEK